MREVERPIRHQVCVGSVGRNGVRGSHSRPDPVTSFNEPGFVDAGWPTDGDGDQRRRHDSWCRQPGHGPHASRDRLGPASPSHSRRVATYSVRLAMQYGLPPKLIDTIRIGALLHDVGKMLVPSRLLTKPGRLSDREWSQLQHHPVLGLELIERLGFDDTVAEIVLYHHERADGLRLPGWPRHRRHRLARAHRERHGCLRCADQPARLSAGALRSRAPGA